MTEFFTNYGLFLAKTITVVIAIIVIMANMVMLSMKQKKHKGDLEVKKINQVYEDYKNQLEEEILTSEALKKAAKEKKALLKKNKKKKSTEEEKKNKIFVLDFDGDIKASAVDELRQSITAVLCVATPSDEIVVKVESPGGMVHGYGLAASQLVRIKDRKIPLTIAVDKVAASGGYMMACVANKIISAPFAILGSIGVVAELPNFHRLLKKLDIDYEQMTAGEFKRTVSIFAENTDKGKQKFQQELEETHDLFKEFVEAHRPDIDIKALSTGEHWFGLRALQLKLIDEIQTSDDYLMNKSAHSEIFEVSFHKKKSMAEKLQLATLKLFNRF